MKIALCLSGQPRYFNICYPNIKKLIIERYNPDVFFHCWWNSSYVGQRFDFSPHANNRTGTWVENTDAKLLELYNPKKYKFEPHISFDTTILNGAFFAQQSPHILYSMWYSIFQANELKKQFETEYAFIYDIVIRLRFDIVFNQFKIDFLKLDLDYIHVSGEIKPLCNDQFALGNSENMNYYSSLYNNINKYWLEDKIKMVNEHVLTHHLNKEHKKICFHDPNEFLVNITKL
jgi:hypothetical protein